MTRAIRSSAVVVLVAACLLAPGSTAHAAVPVRFEVSIGAHHPTGPLYAACDLSVPEGTRGVAVLDAAVASGCIASYELAEFPGFGRYVSCIDGICQIANGLVTFWALFYDDAFATEGIDAFEATGSRQLELTYTSLTCLALC